MNRRNFLQTASGLSLSAVLNPLIARSERFFDVNTDPVPGSRIKCFGDGRDWFFEKCFGMFILFITMLTFGNNAAAENKEIQYQPGVAISFDDHYVSEWYEANEVFREYNWKATFYISRFYRLSEEEIEKLDALQKEGHEIAAHGFHHIRATDYIAENGVQAYLDYEINPMMEMMHANNFFPTTFAYPYGNRNSAIDTLLLDYFDILRGTTRATPDLESLRAFFENSGVVYGLGIDSQRADFELGYVLSVLQYAKDNNKILIIFGHKTVPDNQDRNETDYKTLVEICKFVVENNMRFYTMDELSDIIEK